MTMKWRIVPRVTRTYDPSNPWETSYKVQSSYGWFDSWFTVDYFKTRTEAEHFIRDWKSKNNALTTSDTAKATEEEYLRTRFNNVWAETDALHKENAELREKLANVARKIAGLDVDRTDIYAKLNALEEASKPKRRTRR